METPNPTTFRKYIYEYALLGLTSSVVYLFVLFMNLNTYIREEFTEHLTEQNKVIIKNTEVIQNFINLQNNQK